MLDSRPMITPAAQSLFDKLWASHQVAQVGESPEDAQDLIYIDRIFLHERTGSIALKSLQEMGRKVKDPARVFCTIDHVVDTFPGRGDDTLLPSGREFISTTRAACQAANIRLFDIDDPWQGISHVIAAELGIVLPGLSTVCPDSHTCTLGAMGALAIGIGSSEAEHALATNTLQFHKPPSMRLVCKGTLQQGVSAKDLALHLIAHYGSRGGKGCAVEFAGPAVEALELEARYTLCNMAAEFGAFTAVIAPDEKVFAALRGTGYAPSGDNWDRAVSFWRGLGSDTGAHFDTELEIDAAGVKPMVSWGNSPQHSIAIDQAIPDPDEQEDALVADAMRKALGYQDLHAGDKLRGLPIDAAFIGSCTNARLSDLRIAAQIVHGLKVANGIRAVVVPGSQSVKHAAEAEGLDEIFQGAGFEWRESGCSMCFHAGGETFGAGKRVISTTNRNFEGRQGPGTRTHLASPAVVAASALAGCVSSPPAV